MNTPCRSAMFVNTVESYSRANREEVYGKEKPRRGRGHYRIGIWPIDSNRCDIHVCDADMNDEKRECWGKQKFKTDASARRRARYIKLRKGKGKWAR